MLAVDNGSHLTFVDLNIFTLRRLDLFSSVLVLNKCTCNLPISGKRQTLRRTFRIFPSQRTCTWTVEKFKWFLNGFMLMQHCIHVTSRCKTLNKAWLLTVNKQSYLNRTRASEDHAEALSLARSVRKLNELAEWLLHLLGNETCLEKEKSHAATTRISHMLLTVAVPKWPDTVLIKGVSANCVTLV